MTVKPNLVKLVEAALFVAGRPLSVKELQATVLAEVGLARTQVNMILEELVQRYQDSGIELVETASGFQFKARQQYAPHLANLWAEKAPKFSRAMLETLTLIAYRQPITRGEIEAIRGVAVSSHIISVLKERHWIRSVGHKEIPGRPTLFATTNNFLDYFGLKDLADLPELDQSLLEKLPQDFQT
ncbi:MULTISPECIES: SMC-Scp complex subunit ScpB [unclassified Agarivorans]|uniref:SMC-Scp complex subunit ScpB n=1 Tax=unclassified Agarivorans TaxID=2636026 RepID=UPI0010EB7A22|nr:MULTISPECIES: SMC-Scp complex subunit ScpB [unclassified Agarivorans]MDO6765272.1 SMC-Scp complex subunit ScpB [Agarivorans sp. 1_MG-2023]GDY28243.1 segregation and condensation protein B [Agarivorans sp. Toyoura001]